MEKVIIQTEISRDALGMVAQIAGTEIDDDLLQKLTKEPITVDLKDVEDKEARLVLTLVLAGLAINKVEGNA